MVKYKMGLFWWILLGFALYYFYLYFNGIFNFEKHSQTIYTLIAIGVIGKLIF